jgi:hypothetical protein
MEMSICTGTDQCALRRCHAIYSLLTRAQDPSQIDKRKVCKQSVLIAPLFFLSVIVHRHSKSVIVHKHSVNESSKSDE